MVTVAPKSASPSVGSPIASADTTSLKVDGVVVCTNTSHGASRFSQTEMLLRIDGKFDELPEDGMSGVQIAIAGGTNYVSRVGDTNYVDAADGSLVPLYVYCRPKGGSGERWCRIDAVPTNTWARVTMVEDYASGLCKVCVDGIPAVSEAGYLTTNKTYQVGVQGAWYELPNKPAGQASAVGELKIRGTMQADDVVISQTDAFSFANSEGASSSYAFAFVGQSDESGYSTGTTNIHHNLLSKWGIDNRNVREAMLDASGLTVSQKLEAGLDPLDGSVFEQAVIERSPDGAKMMIAYNGSSKDEWHRVELADANDPDRVLMIYYERDPSANGAGRNGAGWYSKMSTSSEYVKTIPVFATDGAGRRTMTFDCPEGMRSARSLILRVAAVTNDGPNG